MYNAYFQCFQNVRVNYDKGFAQEMGDAIFNCENKGTVLAHARIK
jgi:hypothetical protein